MPEQGLNKAMFIGRVGKDPELRYTAGGTPVCTFSLGMNEVWRDKTSGEQKTACTWARIVAWNSTAEFLGQRVHTGDRLYVEGRYKNREYEHKGQKCWAHEFHARQIIVVAWKNGKQADVASPVDESVDQPGMDDVQY